MMDCCTLVSREIPATRRSSAPSRRKCRRPGHKSGMRRKKYPMMPRAETPWAITVAQAAPATPQPATSTRYRSRATFSTVDTSRKISGAAEFPTLRRAAAKKLYRNTKKMPPKITRR